MGITIGSDNKTSWGVDIIINDLQYAPSNYDEFKAIFKNLGTNYQWEEFWTDSSTSGSSTQKHVLLEPANEYEVNIEAKYNGVWYSGDNYYPNLTTPAVHTEDVRIDEDHKGIVFTWGLIDSDQSDYYKVEVTNNSTGVKETHDGLVIGNCGYYSFYPSRDVGYEIRVINYKNNIASINWGFSNYETKYSLSMPSLGVNVNGSVLELTTDKYDTVIEYEQVNTASNYPFLKTTRDFFYEVSMMRGDNMSLGYTGDYRRFPKNTTVRYKLEFGSGVSSSDITKGREYLDAVLSRLNSLSTQHTFSRIGSGSYEILVQVDSKANLFGSGSQSNGSWVNSFNTDGHIYDGTCKVSYDPTNETYEHVMWEECIQVLGLGRDNIHTPTSIFFEQQYPDPAYLSGDDAEIFKILYNHDLMQNGDGVSNHAIAKELNCVCYNQDVLDSNLSSSLPASHFVTNVQYKIRAFRVDGSSYSAKTDWQYFTITNPRPTDWIWNLNSSGQAFNLTAIHWNNFTSRINEFRTYKGMSNYAFSTAYSGNDFSSAKFRQAIFAIDEMSPTSGIAPELVDFSLVYTGAKIYRWYFSNISGALNSIP